MLVASLIEIKNHDVITSVENSKIYVKLLYLLKEERLYLF